MFVAIARTVAVAALLGVGACGESGGGGPTPEEQATVAAAASTAVAAAGVYDAVAAADPDRLRAAGAAFRSQLTDADVQAFARAAVLFTSTTAASEDLASAATDVLAVLERLKALDVINDFYAALYGTTGGTTSPLRLSSGASGTLELSGIEQRSGSLTSFSPQCPVTAADACQYQAAVHAIGDQTLNVALKKALSQMLLGDLAVLVPLVKDCVIGAAVSGMACTKEQWFNVALAMVKTSLQILVPELRIAFELWTLADLIVKTSNAVAKAYKQCLDYAASSACMATTPMGGGGAAGGAGGMGGAGGSGGSAKPGEHCTYLWGDPHFVTSDGRMYDFQFAGEFVVAEGPDFMVQMRSAPRAPDEVVAFVTAVAARIDGETFEFYPGNTTGTVDVLRDGEPLTSSLSIGSSTSGALVAAPSGTNSGNSWPDGSRIEVRRNPWGFDVYVCVPTTRSVTGLAGNFDGSSDNDLLTRDGTPVTDTRASGEGRSLADSYRTAAGESIFTRPDTVTDLAFPSSDATLGGLGPDAIQAALAECMGAHVAQPSALASCVLDVGTTGDPALAAAAAEAPAAVQSNGGIYCLAGDPDCATFVLSPRHPDLQFSALVVAPGSGLHRYTGFTLDLSAFANGGTLSIVVRLGSQGCAGSFDVYPGDVAFPTSGSPSGTLAAAHDRGAGSSSTLTYTFTDPTTVLFGAEGNWFSAVDTTNIASIEVHVSEPQ